MKSKKNFRTKRFRDKTRKGGGKTVVKKETNDERIDREKKEREMLILDRINKIHFRSMFMAAYIQFIDAIKRKDEKMLNRAIKQINEVFENPPSLLKILIPVTHQHIPINKETYTSNTPFVRFEPALVILFHATLDSSTRIELANAFMKKGGDLKLLSNKDNISSLSEAIELKDKDLVKFLFSNGVSKNILNKEQTKKLTVLRESKNVVKNVTKNVVKNVTKNVVKNVSKNVTKNVTKNIAKNMKNQSNNVTKKSVSFNVNAPNIAFEPNAKVSNQPFKEPNILLEPNFPINNNAPNNRQNANVKAPQMNRKLNYSMELPMVSVEEPEFWKPLFKENEMTDIKARLNEIMRSDTSIEGNKVDVLIEGYPTKKWVVSDLWSVCKINKSIIPTYSVKTMNDKYSVFHTIKNDLPEDFARYQILLCSALLVFGIISKKMVGQDYTLLFKGGKAIQLALSGIPNTEEYDSDDIDIIIVPTKDVYNQEHVKNLAGHVSYLVKWFLSDPEFKFNISIQEPINPMAAEQRPVKRNPSIFKLSYVKDQKTRVRDYKTNQDIFLDDYRQFSDIDFGELDKNSVGFFKDIDELPHEIKELDQSVLFRFPKIDSLLDEKLYYYSKYSKFWEILHGVNLNTEIDVTIRERMYREPKKIEEEDYKHLTPDECTYYLEKFKKAILALNHGIQKKKFPQLSKKELLEREKRSITNRLNNNNIQVPPYKLFKGRIVQSLYP
jgi:hypothetical protein